MGQWAIRIILALSALLIATPSPAARPYATKGQCDEFPKVSLTTRPGSCVGLVGSGLGFPRGLVEHEGWLYITDLGARMPNRGRLLRVRLDKPWKPTVLLTKLDRPGAIVKRDDGFLYIAEAGRIIRVDPDAPDKVDPVVIGLPADGLHNLPGLAVARGGGLFIALGSSSDNCEDDKGKRPQASRPCPELGEKPPRGSILFLAPGAPRPAPARALEVFASGIRSALALLQLPDGLLLAASNGRDSIDSVDPRLSDEKLPHDMLLAVTKGSRHGWPYCFDLGRPSPEYPRANCRQYARPAMLFPPHAAPLAMLAYRGTALAGAKGKLVVAYHGYRAAGHRVVAFATNAKGLPIGASIDLVSGWTAARGVRPQGAPVAMLERADGSILILEDHNGTLLRLALR